MGHWFYETPQTPTASRTAIRSSSRSLVSANQACAENFEAKNPPDPWAYEGWRPKIPASSPQSSVPSTWRSYNKAWKIIQWETCRNLNQNNMILYVYIYIRIYEIIMSTLTYHVFSLYHPTSLAEKWKDWISANRANNTVLLLWICL